MIFGTMHRLVGKGMGMTAGAFVEAICSLPGK
jgi:hypothetical protein